MVKSRSGVWKKALMCSNSCSFLRNGTEPNVDFVKMIYKMTNSEKKETKNRGVNLSKEN